MTLIVDLQMIDQRALWDDFDSSFRGRYDRSEKILNLTSFSLFLDPVEKKTYFQSSGETTSYSGRIDSQSGRNDFGRTGHRAKRPASN